MLLLRNEGQV